MNVSEELPSKYTSLPHFTTSEEMKSFKKILSRADLDTQKNLVLS